MVPDWAKYHSQFNIFKKIQILGSIPRPTDSTSLEMRFRNLEAKKLPR